MESSIQSLKLHNQRRKSNLQYDWSFNPYSQSCESTPISEVGPELIDFSQYIKKSEIKKKSQLPPLENRQSLNNILTKSFSDANIDKKDISNLDSLLRKSKDVLRNKYSVKTLPKLMELNLESKESFISENTQKFTPTFRDLSCSTFSKRDLDSKLGEEVKKDNTIFPVSSKKAMNFYHEKKKLDSESGSGIMIPKAMKKIKVLRNKFPKDMFIK